MNKEQENLTAEITENFEELSSLPSVSSVVKAFV